MSFILYRRPGRAPAHWWPVLLPLVACLVFAFLPLLALPQSEGEAPPPPAWVAPVVAALRDNPRFLLESLDALIMEATEEDLDPARVQALRDLAAGVRLRYVPEEQTEYAGEVLKLLLGPAAALIAPEERLGVVTFVVARAQARCAALSAWLDQLASEEHTTAAIAASLGIEVTP